MATHEIKANLDVDGEVQGTSLDVNGNADISGTTALGGKVTITTTNDSKLNLRTTSGDSSEWNYIDFTGTNGTRDSYIGTDSNGNPLWNRDDGNVSLQLNSNYINASHRLNVQGELEATSLDINGNADISGNLTGVDSITASATVQAEHLYSTDDLVVNDDATISGDLTVSGVNYGLYHGSVEDGYYFDDYNGSRNLSMILKNQRSDIIRYQPVDNYEYWNGSAWVADASQEANIKLLLDGRQDTGWSVPARDYKFRFTTNQSSGWPIRANIGIQTSWSGSTFEGCQMLVEHYESSSWVLHATMEFGGSGTSNNSNDNGIDNWGLMFKADSALHDGQGSSANTTRITIDFYGWSPSNSSYTTIPLQNIFITSNYAGTENTDYTNLLDHNRDITIPGNIMHEGDTNTYFGFHAADQWRVVTGGSERLEVSNSGLKLGDTGAIVTQILDEDNMATNSATALATQQSIKAYADTKLPLAGGTMSGAIAMGNNNITGGGTITGTTLTGTSLDINGAADISGVLTTAGGIKHTGDTDTEMVFGTNDIKLKAGGATHFHAVNDQTTVLYSGNAIALSLDTSQNATFAGNVDIYTGAGDAEFNIGRNSNERLQIYQNDLNTILTADNDSDTNGTHNFILNRTFEGTGANNFVVQKDGTAQLTIDTNAGATFAGSVTTGGTVNINNAGSEKKVSFDRTGGKSMSIEHDVSSMYFYNETDSTILFRMFNAGAATLTGVLTSTGLDINGNADISGNLTGVDTLTATTLSVTNYGLASGDIPNNAADTSGTAAIATTVTVADESSDTSCNVLFTTAATGNLGPKSGTNLTFNSSSGILTATGFAGALTGNVTGNASGSSGSCTGNAVTATTAALATQSTIVANNSANETCYPVFVDGATGAQGLETDTGWTFNPSTGTLTTQKLATDVASIVENNKDGSALMTLTGQGAGNESNISLKMAGTSNGNPIKMKMTALDSSGSSVGAGLLSYDADDDSFGIGQSSSHNRMAIKMENTITSPVDGSTYVYYEPTSIKAREYVASSNSSHYDFNGDIMRNGNDTTVRGKMYVFKNGTWTITNADTKLDSNGLLGMALGTNSTTHGMLLKGTFTLDYDPGGAGNPLYISTTDGVASTTVPSTSGHIVRLVGYLIGGTHGNIFFDPDKTYIEVA